MPLFHCYSSVASKDIRSLPTLSFRREDLSRADNTTVHSDPTIHFLMDRRKREMYDPLMRFDKMVDYPNGKIKRIIILLPLDSKKTV